ncbi:UNVERIFIED_CONTAM: hypothetical protein OHV15_08290 [Microbacterium sp. SLM126]
MGRVARWALVSVVVSVALVVGLIAPVDVARAEDTPTPAATVAPVLPSSPSPRNDPTTPDGDFAPVESAETAPADEVAPPAAGQDFGAADPAGMDVVSRSEFLTTYGEEDGSRVARISLEPLNAEVDGEWVEIDPAVAAVDDGWEVERHPLSPEFSDSAEDTRAVVVSRRGHQVASSLVGADAGTTESPFWFWDAWDELAYRDVLPDADLEYTITAGSVKEPYGVGGYAEGTLYGADSAGQAMAGSSGFGGVLGYGIGCSLMFNFYW